jgi:hypothetical protein
VSALATFRTLRKKLTPSWLHTGDSELVGYALDLIKDAFITRVFQGLLVGYPQQDPNGTAAPVDALAMMGRDRRVVRGIGETDEAYALRLRQFLTDRRTCGNPFTLMKVLAAYLGDGTSFRTVDVRGNWYSRSSAGVETSSLAAANWDWDGAGSTARWSRFWVIIYPGTLWNTTTDDWGDADLDWAETDHVWGCTATPDQVATVKHLIRDWKPAGTRCVEVIAAFDANSFDPTAPEPDGTWDRWGTTTDGVRVASRLSTARYFGGTS